MRHIHPRGPFRKDLKRLSKRGWDLNKLHRVISLLQTGGSLPTNTRPHKLTGEWLGFSECHIGPNWLLIYDIGDTEVLLARTGTHADLFE